MAFSIKDFKSEINHSGLSRISNYEVIVTRSFDVDYQTQEKIKMRCIATDLPGRSFTTVEHKVYGPTQKIATEALTGEITLQIILSEDHREREFFEEWFDQIIGPHRLGVKDGGTFSPNFYDNYIGLVDIIVYDDVGNESYAIQLQEAFPQNINQISLLWADSGFQVLPITFAYRYYTKL